MTDGLSAKNTESSRPRSAICASRWKWATSRLAAGSDSGSRQAASWWPLLIRKALRIRWWVTGGLLGRKVEGRRVDGWKVDG